MDREKWLQLDRIMERVFDLGPREQRSFIERECGDDPVLMETALKLLRADSELDDFLEKPILSCINDAASKHASRWLSDLKSLKNYRIGEELGEGGMGLVFLAEQTGVRRKVALKVIKAGWEDDETIARFRAEYQSLARLEHEFIARIYDFGATRAGRPFFTMEYFPGMPITAYAEKMGLNLETRIQLMIQVCEGIQHAHWKGIIHRDLKPSNILVAGDADKPRIKIIDFGIAKGLERVDDEHRVKTDLGKIMGTPAYMSPEQVDGTDIDTRVDVYGLGAVLYELLTGKPPLDLEGNRDRSQSEIMKWILEEEVTPPSVKLKKAGGAARIGPTVRGSWKELDWVACRALAKDRSRRYGTVAELESDLKNYLADRPVLAGPPTALYLLNKFIKRHRAGVVAAALVLFALVAATFFSLYSANRAAKSRDQAIQARSDLRVRAEESEALFHFLRETLESPNPLIGDREVTVAERLDQTGPTLETRFAGQPKIRAALYMTFGRTYMSLGKVEKAHDYFLKSYELRRDIFGPFHDDTLWSLERLAASYMALKHYSRAEALLESVIDDTCPAELHFQAKRGLAALYLERNELKPSVTLYREVLDFQLREGAFLDKNTLFTISALGGAYHLSGDYPRADFFLSWAWGLQDETLEPENRDTLITLNRLANLRMDASDYRNAEDIYRYIHVVNAARFGEDHPETLDSLHGVCRSVYHQGRYALARDICGEVYDVRSQALGGDHPETLKSGRIFALAMAKTGAIADAESLLRGIMAQQLRHAAGADPFLLSTVNNLANILIQDNRPDDAGRVLREYLDGPFLEFDLTESLARCTLAEVLTLQKRFADALSVIEPVYFLSKTRLPAKNRSLAFYQGLLGYLYAKTGRVTEGETHLLESYAVLSAVGDPLEKHVRGYLIEIYEQEGLKTKADSLRR